MVFTTAKPFFPCNRYSHSGKARENKSCDKGKLSEQRKKVMSVFLFVFLSSSRVHNRVLKVKTTLDMIMKNADTAKKIDFAHS